MALMGDVERDGDGWSLWRRCDELWHFFLRSLTDSVVSADVKLSASTVGALPTNNVRSKMTFSELTFWVRSLTFLFPSGIASFPKWWWGTTTMIRRQSQATTATRSMTTVAMKRKRRNSNSNITRRRGRRQPHSCDDSSRLVLDWRRHQCPAKVGGCRQPSHEK